MNRNFFILLLLSISVSFYSIDSEEWFFISEPATIKSMTQDSFNMYFLSDNKIYSYDFMTEEFFYDVDLSQNIISEEKHILIEIDENWSMGPMWVEQMGIMFDMSEC